MRMNPEVEIKELNAVIDQLTERAEKAERERAALAAHVERFKKASLDAIHQLPGGQVKAELRDVYDDVPETSLARLKAQWQAEALEDYGNQHFGAGSNELWGIQADAKRLHRQAEAQPNSVEDDV